ncbi:MAG: hypothetical protein H0W76_14470 [Pyrinomonadaceae bacterium]|nr:hypothetical protein [Pyrinomonadaceae bacterium]
MHHSFIHRASIIRLTALALLSLSFIQLPVHAMMQGDPSPQGNVHLHMYWGAVGLARGQTLRYTWANLNDLDPQQREFEPLCIQVRLLAADGSVIAQAGAATVGAGQFQSFDFHRDQINLPGEPGTGRLQVRLEVSVELRRRNLVTTSSFDNFFDDAAEVIDTLTGRTTVSFKPKEIVVVGTKIR